MRPAAPWLMSIGAFLLAACGGASAPQLLSDRGAFDGTIRIESRAGGSQRVLAGELHWDRDGDVLRFTRASDGVTLERSAGEPLVRIRDGERQEPTLADEGDFALLMTVLTSRPEVQAEVEAIDGGYAIVQGANAVRVTLAEAAPGGS